MSQMGWIGALGGAGKGTADIGESLMKDSLMRQQQTEDDERRMRIEEFRIGAARAEADRQFGMEREAKKEDSKAQHEYRMEEIKTQGRYGKSAGAPAEVQTIEWASANLFKGDKAKAAEWVKNARSNPQETALRYAKEASRQQEEADVYPDNPSYKSFDQLYNEALGAIQKGGAAGGMAGGSGANKPSGAPYPDGTRLRGKDGKMYEVKNGQPVPVQ